MAQNQELGGDLRAAAAEALGKTGNAQAGQALVKLYDNAQKDIVKAGACSGLAELCGRIGPDSAMPNDARDRLEDAFLQIAANSGSGGDAAVELQAGAIRAAAHMGVFDIAQNARVLKGLEQRFDWQVPRQQQQDGSRGGMMGGGRSRRGGGGSGGSSHPVKVRLAVAEAASTLTGHSQFGQLAERAAGALRNEDDLAEVWQDRAVALARMGKAPCLQFVGRLADLLDLDTLKQMPDIADERDELPAAYFTLLGQVAATSGGDGGQQQRGGMPGGMRSEGMMQMMRGRGGASQGGQQADDEDFLPDPELDEPHEWPLMQWACVEALTQAPEQVLGPMLKQGQTGLVNNGQVGPVAAVYLSDRVSGFNVSSYLQSFFTSHGDNSARRNGLLAARRAGPGVSSGLVRALLAGQLQARSGGRGGGSRQSMGGMAAMMQGRMGGRGRGDGGQEVNITLYAARALGSMGQRSTLSEAWRRGSAEIARAAAQGMAFLPSDQNPAAAIGSLPGQGNPQALQALSAAATTAGRVALSRSSTQTSSGGE
jgi:hypothetical protein